MNRVSIIQGIIDRKHARNYLEIGVQSGDTFLRLRAAKKMAVDPRFLIPWTAKFNWLRWNWYNIFNEYFEMTSDRFFEQHAPLLGKRGLDVVFVDGLHTYEQSRKDIEHALRYLHEDGVILIDDCNPPSERAANPIKPNDNKAWTGDVWKSIAYLRSARPDLDIFVLDCVCGLGVLTRKPANDKLNFTEEEIDRMTYQDFDKDRIHILNLKKMDYFNEFIESL